MNISKVIEVLEAIESAPSAHILVKSFVAAVPDSEIDEIYNSSEGYNDEQTRLILESMSKQTLQELINELKSRELDEEDEHTAKLISSL
jgi:hypothetical protein